MDKDKIKDEVRKSYILEQLRTNFQIAQAATQNIITKTCKEENIELLDIVTDRINELLIDFFDKEEA